MLSQLLTKATGRRAERVQDITGSIAGCLLIGGVMAGSLDMILAAVPLVAVFALTWLYLLVVGK